jgi:uncharacterized protein (TIGR00288 family)
LAVFIDFENLGLGFQNRRDRFDIHKVLERLVEKGKIVAKKAYADWSRFSSYTTALHEAAIELVEIPRRGVSGKNSADIRLVVDAIDLAYSKDHIDTFVIVSGDSDFSPLVSKLKELGKHVIGMGLADATSDLLRDNCDEFIYYEDLDRAPIIPVSMNENIPERKRKAFSLLLESLLALRRENKEIIYSSMIKDTMKRKKPSFNEEYYGYRTFSEFLEDAQRLGLLELEKHKPSGMYIVTRFGLEMEKSANADDSERRNGGGATWQVSTATGERSRPGETRMGHEHRSDSGSDISRKPSSGSATASTAAPRPKHAELQEPLSAVDYPLGRALIEEAEWEDDVDEVPSYGTTLPPMARQTTSLSGLRHDEVTWVGRPREKGSATLSSQSKSLPVGPRHASPPNPAHKPSASAAKSGGSSTKSAASSRTGRTSAARRGRAPDKATGRTAQEGTANTAAIGRSKGLPDEVATAHTPRPSISDSGTSAAAVPPPPLSAAEAPSLAEEEAEFRAGLED